MNHLDDQWTRLVEFLNERFSATAVEPGRAEVVLRNHEGETRTVQILMTADQWEDMAGVMWGNFDDAAQEVTKSLLEMQSDQSYLLFGQYELHPSSTSEFPRDPQFDALNALARQHPEGFGTWKASHHDGNNADEAASDGSDTERP